MITWQPSPRSVTDCAQFSEYGCNKVQPRVFDEVQALYGPQMTSLSGGLVYEYSQEEENYGLVVLNSNGSVSLTQDYDNLQNQYNKLDISLVQSTTAQSTQIKAPACNSSLISTQNFSKNFTIPAVCPDCQGLIDNGISNPTNGKLVNVQNTQVKQAVYGSTGVQVQNLQLTIVSNDGSNTPGGQNTSPSGTGSAAKPTASKKGAAGQLVRSAWVWACLLVGVILI